MHFLRNFKRLSLIAFTVSFLVATAAFYVFPAHAYSSGFLGSPILEFYGLGNLGSYGLGSGYGSGIGYGFPALNLLFAPGIPYYPAYPAFINPLINNPLIPFASGLGSLVSPWFTSAIPPAPFLPITSLIPSYPVSYPGTRSPSGRYSGAWTSLMTRTTHKMELEIFFIDSPTYFQGSTVRLFSNELIPVEIDLSGGYKFPDNFTLTGTYLNPVSLVTYTLELNCTYMFSGKFPRIIQGNYTIYDPLNAIIDKGTIYGESYDVLS